MSACDPIELESADGARLVLRAHGGHVTNWAPAVGSERLWLSRDTGCGPGVAIRGGVPVIWPQFSGRGPLPKHGFARDRAWSVAHAGLAPDGAAAAELRLADDEATRALWPHAFTLVLAVRALGQQLRLSLTASNEGDSAFEFTVALHAYFAVTDLSRAVVHGVAGADAQDNAADGAPLVLPDGPLDVAGPLDLVVLRPSGPLRLVEPGLPDLTFETDGLPDAVVWNPGAGSAPSDVHPGGEAEFACVEPAALTPVVLLPGARWRASVVVTAARP